ncbi:MAG: transglutaminase-like domain-containing protein [Planctomycetota bacterium]
MRNGRLIGLVCGVAFVAGGGLAQQPGNPLVNAPGDVLTRVENTSRLWTLESSVTMVRLDRMRYPDWRVMGQGHTGRRLPPPLTDLSTRDVAGYRGFPEHTFVMPMVFESSGSVAYPDRAFMRVLQREPYSGQRRLGPDTEPVRDVTVTNTPVLIRTDPDSFGTIEIGVPALSTRTLDVGAEVHVRTWETRIDERAADAIGWPSGDWPDELARYLVAETYVKPDAEQIVAAVNECTTEEPEARLRPYATAKRIAACVMPLLRVDEQLQIEVEYEATHCPVAGTPIVNMTTTPRPIGEGPLVFGSVPMASSGVGTSHDVAALMCAVYRAAGLPARLVVGVDVERQAERGINDALTLRSWCEFALYDEARGVVEWIPVDIARQIEWSSRTPPLTEAWQYFGNHDGLDTTVPISNHFVIPGTGSPLIRPGLWGYRGVRSLPPMATSVGYSAQPVSVRADDPPDPYAP